MSKRQGYRSGGFFTWTRIVYIIIFIGLVLLTYATTKHLFDKPQIELFTIQADKYYGNLLVSEFGLAPTFESTKPTKQLIRLPGRVKLTRFAVNGIVMTRETAGDGTFFFVMNGIAPGSNQDMMLELPPASGKFVFKTREALNTAFQENSEKASAFIITGKDNANSAVKITKLANGATAPADTELFWAPTEYMTPKYRLYIADNDTDIKDPAKRTNILLENGISDFQLNTEYSDHTLFEKNGTAKFSGSVLLLEQMNPIRPIYITGYSVYGMASYGPGFADYDVMPEIATTGTADKLALSGSANYKVGYLELVDVTSQSGFGIRIQYDNTYDNQDNRYNAEGPVQLGFANSSRYIFFDEPFIARNIYITGYSGIVKVYGVMASKTDEKTFKLEQNKFDAKGMIIGGQKCPNVAQMMQKQLQAQQICEALEQKDRVRNKKLAYEKDKVYLTKLANQDSEIQALSDKINNLIQKKNDRINASTGLVDAQKLEAELARVEAIRKDAQNFMAKPDGLASQGITMRVNLDPAFGELKKQLTPA